MPLNLTFKKSGKEIAAAIESRVAELQSRLAKRNQDLDRFMEDRQRLRSFLIRSSEPAFLGHGRGDRPAPLYSRDDISSEEKEEVQQLCRRIFEIEQELRRLDLIRSHLNPEQVIDLTYEDLIAYGFDSGVRSG